MSDQGPNRGVRTVDTDSVERALDALRSAGFAVDSVRYIDRGGNGVEFGFDIYESNRTKPLRNHEEKPSFSDAEAIDELGGGAATSEIDEDDLFGEEGDEDV